jgi:hypothetical protein
MDVDELRTHRLVIEDPDGNERAVIGANADGVAITMLDSRGRRRVVIGLNEDDVAGGLVHIAVVDHAGRVRWGVSLEDNEEPCIAAFHADGRAFTDQEYTGVPSTPAT